MANGTVDIEPAADPHPVIGRGAGPGIDRTTGEVLDIGLMDSIYEGASVKPVSKDQAEALLKPPADDEVEIKPDSFGAVFMNHGGYRKRLNAAFHPGGWALRRLSSIGYDETAKMVYVEYALYAEGRYLGSARGEQKWLGSDSDGMTYGDAVEGAKSNALMRCCKDLGMAMDLWSKTFAENLRARLAVKVFIESRPDRQNQSRTTVAWRRFDGQGLPGEIGIVGDSPNKDKYVLPDPPWWRQKAARNGGGNPEHGGAAPNTSTNAKTEHAANSKTISDKQIGLLWAEAKKHGRHEDDVAAYLKATFSVASSRDLTNAQLNDALTWIRKPAAEPPADDVAGA